MNNSNIYSLSNKSFKNYTYICIYKKTENIRELELQSKTRRIKNEQQNSKAMYKYNILRLLFKDTQSRQSILFYAHTHYAHINRNLSIYKKSSSLTLLFQIHFIFLKGMDETKQFSLVLISTNIYCTKKLNDKT